MGKGKSTVCRDVNGEKDEKKQKRREANQRKKGDPSKHL
jgi:hypothetical protein